MGAKRGYFKLQALCVVLTRLLWLARMILAPLANLLIRPGALGRTAEVKSITRSFVLMPIDINKVPSRAKRITVSIEPAEWQMYIAH